MTDTPEYHQYDEFKGRTAKLATIRESGVDPYPHKYTPSDKIDALIEKYKEDPLATSEEAAAGKTPKVSIAGRLVLFRPMGKNAFAQIQDGSSRMQVMFNKELTQVDGLESDHLKFIEKRIDLGDFLGCEGHLFRTHKGELTLFVHKLVLLCKTLLPLPDKHSGLNDKGVRYRKRWLDLIVNPTSKDLLLKRSWIIQAVRRYFEKLGFLEVETPVLQNIYGGAAARPFTTKLHALNQEMFLRISLEIPLKKLLVGGLDKVFEIGKVFRNEGIDRTHNPEFTELEAYAAYWDYNDMMVLVEQLFEQVALELFHTTRIPHYNTETGEELIIELKAPWQRLTMKESIERYAGITVDTLSDKEIKELLAPVVKQEELSSASRGKLISFLFEEYVESKLIQPHHITDHPIETTPLCKLHRDPIARAAGLVERFETFIGGEEFCNSYSELNDPELQRKLLEMQSADKLAGNEEAHPLDEEFLEAICQGMPPAGGLGIGLDRLVMLFTGAASIRDILYFPIMRPEEN